MLSFSGPNCSLALFHFGFICFFSVVFVCFLSPWLPDDPTFMGLCLCSQQSCQHQKQDQGKRIEVFNRFGTFSRTRLSVVCDRWVCLPVVCRGRTSPSPAQRPESHPKKGSHEWIPRWIPRVDPNHPKNGSEEWSPRIRFKK